ncbi:MAG: hypothetical protein HZB67_04330 [Candidatus Aenigmarchaeota archaeon]|nr:hypothetical protein [Candidatus Aenigmarchaeota archaeon]
MSEDGAEIEDSEDASTENEDALAEENEEPRACGPECKGMRGHRVRHFMSDPGRFHVERQMLLIGALTFIIVASAITALYFGYFRLIPNFAVRYSLYLVYATVSIVVIGIGVWHIRAYRHTFNCSLGMMVGMTIGMMAGFLLGAIIGATNGMFMGSVYGMLLGMFIGGWCARNCGIMSIMEGLMAGLMGGLMGAMTTVMMLNDNIVLFMPLLVGSISVIMAGMSVMIYKESEEHRDTIPKNDAYDVIAFVSLLFVLAMLTTFVMIYGHKSALLSY